MRCRQVARQSSGGAAAAAARAAIYGSCASLCQATAAAQTDRRPWRWRRVVEGKAPHRWVPDMRCSFCSGANYARSGTSPLNCPSAPHPSAGGRRDRRGPRGWCSRRAYTAAATGDFRGDSGGGRRAAQPWAPRQRGADRSHASGAAAEPAARAMLATATRRRAMQWCKWSGALGDGSAGRGARRRTCCTGRRARRWTGEVLVSVRGQGMHDGRLSNTLDVLT